MKTFPQKNSEKRGCPKTNLFFNICIFPLFCHFYHLKAFLHFPHFVVAANKPFSYNKLIYIHKLIVSTAKVTFPFCHSHLSCMQHATQKVHKKESIFTSILRESHPNNFYMLSSDWYGRFYSKKWESSVCVYSLSCLVMPSKPPTHINWLCHAQLTHITYTSHRFVIIIRSASPRVVHRSKPFPSQSQGIFFFYLTFCLTYFLLFQGFFSAKYFACFSKFKYRQQTIWLCLKERI